MATAKYNHIRMSDRGFQIWQEFKTVTPNYKASQTLEKLMRDYINSQKQQSQQAQQ